MLQYVIGGRQCLLFELVHSIIDPTHEKQNTAICICETKGADQLRRHCEADQRLGFRYTDSAVPLLSESKISSV